MQQSVVFTRKRKSRGGDSRPAAPQGRQVLPMQAGRRTNRGALVNIVRGGVSPASAATASLV